VRNLIKNRSFLIGFVCGLLLFLCANILIFLNSHCHHCVRVAGFPLVFWEQFMGNINFTPEKGSSNNDFENFYPFNLISDIAIAIIFCFVIGLIFKFIWSKILSSRTELK
jgi:tryptophan-rich sensory protein